MTTRSLGSPGPRVSALGLGCMGMSDFYGPADDDESRSRRSTPRSTPGSPCSTPATTTPLGTTSCSSAKRSAVAPARGGPERQVRAHARTRRVVVGNDLRPQAVKNFLAYTLRRLGTDYVDIYRPGRVFPDLPIEETIGAIAEMVDAGYVRHIGFSEAGAETVRRAHAVHPISDLQIEYSLLSRGIEDEILPTCRELGIGLTAYGVLSRGLLSGHWSKERARTLARTTSAPRRRASPARTSSATSSSSRRCGRVADAKGATVAQIAIAWALSRGEDVVPLVGARRRDRLDEALGALESRAQRGRPRGRSRRHSGGRRRRGALPREQMAILDSERG